MSDEKLPMLLAPAGKDYLWGGERLKKEYGKAFDLTPLAETWECSVHPDGPSVIRNGVFSGKTLSEVLSLHPEFAGGKNTGDFPILVKFIDAAGDLSVQVHPDDSYACQYEGGSRGKTEMWYVLEAEEGAKLICGFEHKVTAEKLRKSLEDGTLDRHLKSVPVHKGDVFYIPAGTVHAIGKGVVIAEIQESSNLTYRLYDYDRVDAKTGKKRELHFDKAVKVMNMEPGDEVRQKPRKVAYYPGCSRELLIRCPYFEAESIRVSESFEFSVTENSFQVLLCTEGYGSTGRAKDEEPVSFKKGDCIFIPAGAGRLRTSGRCSLLKIRS